MKILLADDHTMFTQGLQEIIKQNMPKISQVDYVPDSKQLFLKLAGKKYSLLIQDLKFGKENIEQILQNIQKKYPETKILILSSVTDSSIINKMLNYSDGYVVKSEPLTILLNAISFITEHNNKEKFISPETKKYLKSFNQYDNIVLTKREKEVLAELMKEKTSKQISEELCISVKTVEMHRSNLLIKLNVKNTVGLVKKVIALDLLGL